MPMAVMDVRKMGMFVGQDRMPVLMAVRLGAIPVEFVLVLMMHVVNVWVGVFERLMRVRMLVMLGQMQPNPNPHQGGGDPERRRRRFAQQQDGDGGTDEGCRGEISAGAGRAQIPQCPHKENQAQAIAQQAHYHGCARGGPSGQGCAQ